MSVVSETKSVKSSVGQSGIIFDSPLPASAEKTASNNEFLAFV